MLMPDYLVRRFIEYAEIGLAGIVELAGTAEVSLTAACNVPLNDQLAALDPAGLSAADAAVSQNR